ncbi:MAG: LamG protein [Mucilaginibacter sp.]|nr:LamG protein [Mucilaginibacter sp.]
MKKITNILMISAGLVLCLSSCQKGFNAKSYAPPLSVNGFTSSGQVAKSSLVGYWSFDGSLTDSVSGKAGINTGTSFAAKGIKGQALQGALNSYVLNAPAASIAGLQSYTISFWVNTPPPSVGIISPFALANTTGFWGNLELFFENGSSNTNGIVKLHVQQGNHDNFLVTSNLQNLFNKWISITISYDATSAVHTLYVNGSKVNSAVLGGISGPLVFPNIGNLVFGCDQFQTNPSQTSATQFPGFASFLTGQLDEFRIYNKALSDIEVSSIVNLQGRGK